MKYALVLILATLSPEGDVELETVQASLFDSQDACYEAGHESITQSIEAARARGEEFRGGIVCLPVKGAKR